MAKKAKKSVAKSAAPEKRKAKRVAWTKAHDKELRGHSKAKSKVTAISKLMKRTVGSLRQRAIKLGIPLGHRR